MSSWRGEIWTQKTHVEGRRWEDTQGETARKCSGASTGKGIPEAAGRHQKPGEARRDCPPEPSERTQPCPCFAFRLPDSSTLRQ